MDRLVTEVLKSLNQNFFSDISVTVALSGGVDSITLLHVINKINTNNLYPFKIFLDAIHINHGISVNSDSWADFCKKICQNLNIKLTTTSHKIIKNGGESLENNARKIRYDEFYKHKTDVIVLAHHKIDQVETTLTQIFRGSDLHNIAAMRAITQKQNKTFWRPFLNITKLDIEKYALQNDLNHIIDESNQDNQYLRNFIRNKIIPELQIWDINIETKILKINEQIQNILALTDEVAREDLNYCLEKLNSQTKKHKMVIDNNSSFDQAIDITKFRNLSVIRQNNLIGYFILKQNKPLPSTKQISEFIRQLNNCREDRIPNLRLNDHFSIILKNKLVFITS